MKRFMISAICGAMVLSLVACEKGNINIEGKNTNKITSEDFVEIPNPLKECGTLQEAEELVDFKANILTKIPDGYVQDSIYVIGDDIIQVIYLNEDSEICFRQAKGEDDISGDYNEYNETNTINVNGVDITTKGNNGKVNLAIWAKDGYTFAISSNTLGQGLESSVITDMIDSIR